MSEAEITRLNFLHTENTMLRKVLLLLGRFGLVRIPIGCYFSWLELSICYVEPGEQFSNLTTMLFHRIEVQGWPLCLSRKFCPSVVH